jgi:hypothetical protein
MNYENIGRTLCIILQASHSSEANLKSCGDHVSVVLEIQRVYIRAMFEEQFHNTEVSAGLCEMYRSPMV